MPSPPCAAAPDTHPASLLPLLQAGGGSGPQGLGALAADTGTPQDAGDTGQHQGEGSQGRAAVRASTGGGCVVCHPARAMLLRLPSHQNRSVALCVCIKLSLSQRGLQSLPGSALTQACHAVLQGSCALTPCSEPCLLALPSSGSEVAPVAVACVCAATTACTCHRHANSCSMQAAMPTAAGMEPPAHLMPLRTAAMHHIHPAHLAPGLFLRTAWRSHT